MEYWQNGKHEINGNIGTKWVKSFLVFCKALKLNNIKGNIEKIRVSRSRDAKKNTIERERILINNDITIPYRDTLLFAS